MAQWLNKILLLFLFVLISDTISAQAQTGGHTVNDYKDSDSHERFRKRRVVVGAWQINQLKTGALVVRLKTNNNLIKELRKRGDSAQAEKIRLERAAININYMRAFMNYYKFSKVYFIYSHSSDSLLNGTRSGIFVDTTLNVNPSIRMNEKFYLLAESDFVYNTTIGFIREDSVKNVSERGTPSSSEYPVVIKNKYGHQLKGPFPYHSQKYLVFAENEQYVDVRINGVPVGFSVWAVNKKSKESRKMKKEREENKNKYIYRGKELYLTIPREMTYNRLVEHVMTINSDLKMYHRSNMDFSEESKNYADAKPFFY